MMNSDGIRHVICETEDAVKVKECKMQNMWHTIYHSETIE